MSAANQEPKMASQILGEDPKVGSVLQVEVEQALPDLLMVSLKSGGKIFRGCLIDTFSRACPVGIPDTSNLGARLNKEFGVTMMDTAVILPKEEPGMGDTATKVENSALSFRQSYFQNMPLPPARPLIFGKKDKTPEIKPKTMNHGRSRQFKLRPRQLLCSKCQGACPTVKAKTASRNRTEKNNLKKRKADSADVVARKKPRPDPRATTNGGSNVSKQHGGTAGSRPLSTPAKSENKSQKKTSPAIKISYATPGKGQRLIVRIPPRTNNFKQSTASPRIAPKNKNRVLTVPLSPLSPSLVKQNVVKKRPLVNGVHKAPVNSPHDKIRIVKTKGTYSIPNDKIPVRTYSPLPGSPKIVNGSGKVMANVTVKPIPLLNGYRSTGIQEKKEGPLSTPSFLPPLDNSDTASDCSSHTSRGSRKGGRKSKQNGSINNNNSECEFDSDASSLDPPKKKEEPKPNNHKKNVTKSILPGGRTVCVGDIIWGKITGFPWWPGRIVQIIVTRSNEGSITKQEAQITWFASRSISFMPLTKLPSFLGEFKKHYDKKRKGLYKEAITQATKAAEALSSEVRELHTMFETPLLNKS